MTGVPSTLRGLPAVLALAAGVFCSSQVGAATLSEGFDTVTPMGWTVVNHSSPLGSTIWFQGLAGVFAAQAGAASSYAAANYNSTNNVGTISDWLITPTLTFNNGDQLSFYTRSTGNGYADRLEVRFSNVGGTNVGSGATEVGSFTTLLVSVNPSLSPSGYPGSWTEYTATISGLSGPTNGAIGFRYFVTDGGALGSNSDYIGLDTVSITSAVPEPETYALMGLGLAVLGGVARRRAKPAAA